MPTESDSTDLVLDDGSPDRAHLRALARGDGLELLTSKLDVLLRGADVIRASGLAGPNATKETVLAKILMGRELGIGPIAALRTIHVIQGRPCLDASAQLSRAIQNGVTIEWGQNDAKTATLTLRRGSGSYTSTWTMEMAKRAKLDTKPGPWVTHPEAMLRARAITAGIRAFCPDVLDSGGALYSPEEIDDIGRQEQAPPRSAAWTPGEHHASFTDAQAYAVALGDYSKLADWLESDDAGAAGLRRALANRVGDGTLEQPWRPSWVPARVRGELLRVMKGDKGPSIRAACAKWHATGDDIDVEFEAVEPDAAAKEKAPPKPRAKAKDAPKPEAKPEPDPNEAPIVEVDQAGWVEEIQALEQGVGMDACTAIRSEIGIALTATATAIVKHAPKSARAYVERLGAAKATA